MFPGYVSKFAETDPEFIERVVHIDEVTDAGISAYLESVNETISISVTD